MLLTFGWVCVAALLGLLHVAPKVPDYMLRAAVRACTFTWVSVGITALPFVLLGGRS